MSEIFNLVSQCGEASRDTYVFAFQTVLSLLHALVYTSGCTSQPGLLRCPSMDTDSSTPQFVHAELCLGRARGRRPTCGLSPCCFSYSLFAGWAVCCHVAPDLLPEHHRWGLGATQC